MVRYYFYKGKMPTNPKDLQDMVALAYQTARDMKLYPRAILIRSKHHKTTTINGKTGEDPKGWHLTFCYKDNKQLINNTHTACHGYTKDEFSWELIESTHAGDKPDSVKRRFAKKSSVWPGPAELDEAPEIGYGHFPQS
ncbi:hypothetical protein ASPZODRAFT_161467 [Penicilliopsis zonata CBS 506.65]|uniref:Uncharacterized protein n=1 Tax=Penicilliopsis zonata CBS 506.65 TaxID=1073090 RepID=A0A1L9S8N6_9EURO|nr:hypothetical protein ASPZODRAFT_161467 [Penicilliopsis zonata CBS 506.65]OJJ43520.1 hypothetical protein ASPZODRAFT_161467 [Penicilliopsis zonata CBS 506.65]